MTAKRRYNVGANSSTIRQYGKKMMNAVHVPCTVRAVLYTVLYYGISHNNNSNKENSNRTYMVVHHGVVDAFFLAKASWCGGW